MASLQINQTIWLRIIFKRFRDFVVVAFLYYTCESNQKLKKKKSERLTLLTKLQSTRNFRCKKIENGQSSSIMMIRLNSLHHFDCDAVFWLDRENNRLSWFWFTHQTSQTSKFPSIAFCMFLWPVDCAALRCAALHCSDVFLCLLPLLLSFPYTWFVRVDAGKSVDLIIHAAIVQAFVSLFCVRSHIVHFLRTRMWVCSSFSVVLINMRCAFIVT